MNIDLTNLISSSKEELEVDDIVEIPVDMMSNTSIRRLQNTRFCGEVMKLCDGNYQLAGIFSGVMVLPDDVTLEDVEVPFTSQIEEKFGENLRNEENNLKIVQNRLDITEFLWQNILVEIPLKVVNERKKDLTLEGNGWRLVTEEELNNRNDSPFSELGKMFDSRKE